MINWNQDGPTAIKREDGAFGIFWTMPDDDLMTLVLVDKINGTVIAGKRNVANKASAINAAMKQLKGRVDA